MLELGRRTLICGVVNVTPDSFSDGSRFLDPSAAIAHALQLFDEGADLLDLGAESTRPGTCIGNLSDTCETPAVGAQEEQARLIPVLEGIRKARPNAILSVDTYKAETALVALFTGAEIINDVSGLTWDPDLAGVCAKAGCGVVLMHTRGRPNEWAAQAQLPSDELMQMVHSGLQASLKKAADAGIGEDSIVLDPGYGFGKRGEENFALLAHQRQLLTLGNPLLAGVSRKSFLGRALASLHAGHNAPIEARETASVAAMVAAILQGASIVRVHNVRPAVEAALIADALLEQIPDCK
jgi:dihydropteroate synthase